MLLGLEWVTEAPVGNLSRTGINPVLMICLTLTSISSVSFLARHCLT